MVGYVGRFAPSPSGPLHAGSLVAALASWLDARAHGGRWLVRIEDIDTPRTAPGADRVILAQLAALGLVPDDPPVWQSQRTAHYEQAFGRLWHQGRLYGCACTRSELASGPYPGTCRPPVLATPPKGDPPSLPTVLGDGRPVRSWRFRVAPGLERFQDRWLGPQAQDVAHEVGDFIVRRADGLWAYQLAVVVDDNAQNITDIVRGADLLDSTARQRQLARALDLPRPRTLHVPVVLDAYGRKLSKQNHAPPLAADQPLAALQAAWQAMGFAPLAAQETAGFLQQAIHGWAQRFHLGSRAATGAEPSPTSPV